jgi:hypothetical protein
MTQHLLLSVQARIHLSRWSTKLARRRLCDVPQASLARDRRFASVPALRPCDGISPLVPAQVQVRRLSSSVQYHIGHDLRRPQLAFVDLLAAVCLFVNAAKGASALPLSHGLDVQYKTAFVLAHKRLLYNVVRPHSSLGYWPPAPEAIVPSASGLPYSSLRSAQSLTEYGRVVT